MSTATKRWIYRMMVILFAWTWSIRTTTAELDLSNPIAQEIVLRSKGADIKTWLNLEADPCENFFEYACNKWHRINRARLANVYSTDNFQEMSKGMQRKVNQLLNAKRTGDLIEDKLRDFYDSCRDVKRHRNDYKQTLPAIIEEYGQFSFLSKVDDDPPARNHSWWWSTLGNIYKTYGKSIILSLVHQADVKNKSKTMLYISPPDFFMNRAETANDMPIFLTQYLRVADDKAQKVANGIKNFEFHLTLGATDIRLGHTIEEMLTLYNTSALFGKYKSLGVDLELYMKEALNSTQLPQQIYVYDEPYLSHLPQVINNTEPQIMSDYILWLLLEEYVVDGSDKNWDVWCSEKSKKYFGKYIDYVIYKKYRSEALESEVFSLWHEIKSTFHDQLKSDKYQWMSPQVRDHAIRKLAHMRLTINSYDNENFAQFFSNLNIQPNAYVTNIQNILKQTQLAKNSNLQHNSEGLEESQVLSFTPVYNTFKNEIKIPVALLQPFRVWHPIYPNAIKYATIGFLLAHEMIHGFDDEGRQYDADGHTHNWWDTESEEEFNIRRRCFQDQYHNYTFHGNALPSMVTQSENIADNAAVQLAYDAYTKWLQRVAKAEGQTNATAGEFIKNLQQFNNWKIFFLTFAQLWCTDVHEDYTSLSLLHDIHAPAMFRVIGTLSNFNKFSTTFQCPVGSVMNPSKKCAIY